jgi:D-alanyl-D-alanine carboxypeptidase/D-alanyl-D-alanine-endopeptidase (penicillin-binding protein 4)
VGVAIHSANGIFSTLLFARRRDYIRAQLDLMSDNRCTFFLGAWLLFAGALVLGAQETSPAYTVDELRAQMEAHLAQPKFSAALWGIKVVSLDSGKVIFEHHADRLMSPASNSKLYTGAVGLDQFGGDYRFGTPVYAAGQISGSGTLRGDLVVVGHGDPSWNARRLGTNFWTLFEPFVAILTHAGVRRVSGDLIADATYFHGQPTGSGWAIDDLDGGEVGMLSALTLEDNVAQVSVRPGARIGARCQLAPLQPGTGLVFSNQTATVASNGPARLHLYRPSDGRGIFILGELPAGGDPQILDVMVPRPADWFAAALKVALARHGIKVSGHARGLAWPDNGVEATAREVKLGTMFSPPLRDVLRNFMKPSQNLEADTLLADVGEAARAAGAEPRRTSEEAGLAGLDRFLAAAGVPPGEVHFDEGSGLSRNNLTTANATVALLQFMAKHRDAQDFLDALPVAGVDGTLRRRFKDTAAAGNVRAKTGTLRWANALSGYVTNAVGERLAFSIMLNRFAAAPGHSGHDEINPLVLMLANFSARTDEASPAAYAPLGTLLVGPFDSAPFPHLARAAGHKYHEDFYSAADHYSDRTVAMFIPKNFRVTDKIDFVVHFHGWRHAVGGTLAEYNLIGQFAGSGKNAILIVPQGPRDAPDSFGGKLEDTNGFKVFLDEAVAKLRASGALARTNFEIGSVIISGHSGGYHVMAAILDHGGMPAQIREAWLFDALYGNTENFDAWRKNQTGRLVDIYTDHGGTLQETQNLMANYQTNGVSFFAAEETNAVPDNLRTNRIVFLHTDLPHNSVVSKRGEFRRFLEASCLQNLP